jgi:serine/threonine-protein kinase
MATVHYGRLVGPVGFSRTVAIKRLHPQLAKDPEFVAMFLDEARLAGRIRHPNVVQTIDVVTSEDEVFLVMDYVHGEPLARLVEAVRRVPVPIALRIASDVLQGLHAAHEARDEQGQPLNIVHRDISPHNVLVGADGVARLVDFGVAKATGRMATTQDGHIKGKLGYMPPEQLNGEGGLTRRSDIHAFSVVLWEMLAGQRLFNAESEAELVQVVVQHRVPPLSLRGLPADLDAVVQRGLAVHPDERYESAREMCQALEGCGAMAANLAVGDWVQVKVRASLAERAKIVQAIEADRGGPTPAPATAAPVSAKAWVQRLSSADVVNSDSQGARVLATATPAAQPAVPVTPPGPPDVTPREPNPPGEAVPPPSIALEPPLSAARKPPPPKPLSLPTRTIGAFDLAGPAPAVAVPAVAVPAVAGPAVAGPAVAVPAVAVPAVAVPAVPAAAETPNPAAPAPGIPPAAAPATEDPATGTPDGARVPDLVSSSATPEPPRPPLEPPVAANARPVEAEPSVDPADRDSMAPPSIPGLEPRTWRLKAGLAAAAAVLVIVVWRAATPGDAAATAPGASAALQATAATEPAPSSVPTAEPARPATSADVSATTSGAATAAPDAQADAPSPTPAPSARAQRPSSPRTPRPPRKPISPKVFGSRD